MLNLLLLIYYYINLLSIKYLIRKSWILSCYLWIIN